MALDIAKVTAVMRGLTQKFDEAAQAARPFYPSVCQTVVSNGADEGYGLRGAMAGVKEWTGERKYNEVRSADFVIANKSWESSLLVNKDNIADDRIGLYGPLSADLAIEATHHPDELLFEVLVAGTSGQSYDGQNFFDTDHSFGDSGAQSNSLTSTVTDADDVTADEFKAAFNANRIAMLKYRNDMGKLINRPVGAGLSHLMVLCPVEMELAARVALEAPLVNGGDSNVVVDAPVVVSSAHLTDLNKFYMFDLSAGRRPFIFQAREALSRQVRDENNDEVKDVKLLTSARYNLGYGDWSKASLHTFGE